MCCSPMKGTSSRDRRGSRSPEVREGSAKGSRVTGPWFGGLRSWFVLLLDRDVLMELLAFVDPQLHRRSRERLQELRIGPLEVDEVVGSCQVVLAGWESGDHEPTERVGLATLDAAALT